MDNDVTDDADSNADNDTNNAISIDNPISAADAAEIPAPYLTLQRAHKLAHEVVDPKPEFIYAPFAGAQCFYVPFSEVTGPRIPWDIDRGGTRPDPREGSGCLIGEILRRHGVPKSALAATVSSVKHLLPRLVEAGYLVGFESEAGKYLGRLQSEQDGGAPWGEALARIDAIHELHATQGPSDTPQT